MEIILISYTAGMFGDFSSYLFSRGSNNFFNNEKIYTTESNRYVFPNFLNIINQNIKELPHNESLIISNRDLEKLKLFYKDKNIIVNTHWFGNDCNIHGKKIRFIIDDVNILKLSFCLYWIKTHIYDTINEEKLSIKIARNMIKNNHQYSRLLEEILNEQPYQNWKLFAVLNNFLKNRSLDLNFYIKQSFLKYIKINSQRNKDNWFYYDIGKLIHGDGSNINQIENFLNIIINQDIMIEYREKNLKLINNHINLNLNNFKDNNWIENLSKYVKFFYS